MDPISIIGTAALTGIVSAIIATVATVQALKVHINYLRETDQRLCDKVDGLQEELKNHLIKGH